MNRRSLLALVTFAGLGLSAPTRADGQADGDPAETPARTALCPVCFQAVEVLEDGNTMGDRQILTCTADGCGVVFTIAPADEPEPPTGDT